MPSVHSHDSWLKLSCENIVPVVGKAVNCLCVLDLLLTQGHIQIPSME